MWNEAKIVQIQEGDHTAEVVATEVATELEDGATMDLEEGATSEVGEAAVEATLEAGASELAEVRQRLLYRLLNFAR